VKPSVLFISQALLEHQDGLQLHPDVVSWQAQFARMRRRWFQCAPLSPLSCYARLHDCTSAQLLASAIDIPADVRQLWVASPYFAALGRDTLTVMPEGSFSWRDDDAQWLCAQLNPLLQQDDMQLVATGAALLLCCRTPLDAAPADFACLSGGLLPNRHPAGADGGRMMRLIAEIQMVLHQHPAEHRRMRGEADVHGLWFWGASDTHAVMPHLPVATRNPFLASISEARDAVCVISEAERVAELMPRELPRHIVLFGAGHAVWLTHSRLPRFSRSGWQVKSCQSETVLFSRLRQWLS